MTTNADPSPEALTRILNSGLRPRPRLGELIRSLWSDLGPGNLFFGTLTRLLLAASVSALGVALLAATAGSLGMLFAGAPLLFLTLVGFVEGAERIGPLAELRRTLLNSGPQVAAFRTLLFAGAGLGFGLLVCFLPVFSAQQAGHRLLVASLSVSLSALLTLVVLRGRSASRVGLLLPLCWIGFWSAVELAADEVWDATLAGMPILLGWIGVAAATTTFARRISRQLLDVDDLKGVAHAAGW